MNLSSPNSNNGFFNTADALNRSRPENWHYETAVGEIETIIDKIESGEMDLEEVFTQFSLAVDSLYACESFLAERQAQMDVLIETLGDAPHP